MEATAAKITRKKGVGVMPNVDTNVCAERHTNIERRLDEIISHDKECDTMVRDMQLSQVQITENLKQTSKTLADMVKDYEKHKAEEANKPKRKLDIIIDKTLQVGTALMIAFLLIKLGLK